MFCACTIALVRPTQRFWWKSYLNDHSGVPMSLTFGEKILWMYPESKVHGTNMGPIWGWQYPNGPDVGPTNFAIWVCRYCFTYVGRIPWFNVDINFTENVWAGVVNQSALNFTWFHLSRNVQHFLQKYGSCLNFIKFLPLVQDAHYGLCSFLCEFECEKPLDSKRLCPFY